MWLVPALAWGPSKLPCCVTHIWGCPGGGPSILWPKDAAAPFCPATREHGLWTHGPGRALGLRPPPHTLPRVSSRVQPWFLAVLGLDSDGPGDGFPTPGQFVQAPSHGGPHPPQPPVCPTTRPVISGEHTQEVRLGRAHPNPDYPGRSIKSRPSSPGGSLPAPSRPRTAAREAPVDRPGRWASGGASRRPVGLRPQQGLGSISSPRTQQRPPWPRLGSSSIRYGGVASEGQGADRAGPPCPSLPLTAAPAGCSAICSPARSQGRGPSLLPFCTEEATEAPWPNAC